MLSLTERIQKYVEKHPEPEQQSLPKLWIGWKTTTEVFSKNLVTGKIYKGAQPWMKICDVNENPLWDRHENTIVSDGISWGKGTNKEDLKEKFWVKKGAKVNSLYINYDKNLKIIELARIWIDTNKGIDGKPSLWQYDNGWERIFMEFNHKHFYIYRQYDKEIREVSYLRSPLRAYRWNDTVSIQVYIYDMMKNNKLNSFKINELAGIAFPNEIQVSANHWIFFDQCGTGIYYFLRYLEYTSPIKSNSKTQKELDELTKITPEVQEHNFGDLATIETIGDSLLFRNFTNPDTARVDYTKEISRIYITKKGKIIRATLSTRNEWIIDRTQMGSRTLSLNTDLKIFDTNEKTARIKEIIKDLMPCDVLTIINLIQHPLLEKLYKAGYKWLAVFFLGKVNIKATIKDLFLIENENFKKKSIYQILEVNKDELEFLNNNISKIQYFVYAKKYIQFVVGKPINQAGKKEFENIMAVSEKNPAYWGKENISQGIFVTQRESWERQIPSSKICTFTQNRRYECILKLGDLEQKFEGYVQMFKDTIATYILILQNKDDFEYDIDKIYKIKDMNKLLEVHDSLVSIWNDICRNTGTTYRMKKTQAMIEAEKEQRRKEDEEREKKFAKIRKETLDERKKWTYEDDEFVIQVPDNSGDISTEGLVLNHCVGSYATDHLKGDTSILFLRKKDAPKHPFYTIEVRNIPNIGFKVIQIHGRHNAWLSANEEGYKAVPTVVKWLKKNNIQYEDRMLLETSSRYGSSGVLREMPEGV